MPSSRGRRAILLLAIIIGALALLAATATEAARPSLDKKKHHGGGGGGDDDDAPPAPPAPGPDDDDPIAQMKACHAERGKGREACLAVPHCEYCRSSSALPLPNVCAHELEAKLMPGILWECEKGGGQGDEGAEAPAGGEGRSSGNGDACEGLHEAACAASAGVCVWCVAAAVPSSCFTVDQAARLPPGVFTCGVAPSAAVLVAAS